MTETATAADPVKLARIAADKRVALVTVASRRQDKIKSILAKVSEEQAAYEGEYRAAMEAWSKPELDDFGLLAPEQVVKPIVSAKKATAKSGGK